MLGFGQVIHWRSELGTLRIAVFVNANAGAHNQDSRALAVGIEPLMLEMFDDSDAYVIYRTKTLAALDAAIADALKKFRPNVVLTVGGDGTTHQFLTRVIPAFQKFGVELPTFCIGAAGTMNVIPNALELTDANRFGSLERALRLLKLGDPHLVRAHVLKVNDSYGFLYGAGLPVNALERYNAYEKRGTIRAAQVFSRIFMDEVLACTGRKPKQPSIARPFVASLTCYDDDGYFLVNSDSMTAIMAGTIESLGLGSKPMYRARERPENFHLMAGDQGFWSYAKRLRNLVRGGKVTNLVDDPVREVKIAFAPEDDVRRYVDGDTYGNETFGNVDTISCGPLLTFLAP